MALVASWLTRCTRVGSGVQLTGPSIAPFVKHNAVCGPGVVSHLLSSSSMQDKYRTSSNERFLLLELAMHAVNVAHTVTVPLELFREWTCHVADVSGYAIASVTEPPSNAIG